MRFVWAVAAFVLAAVLIGAGIAQRTIFLGPKSQQVELALIEQAPYTLIDGAVLRMHAGAQTLMVRGTGELYVAYGRTADLEAWLADATYNRITVEEGEPTTELISAPSPEAGSEDGTNAERTAESDEAAVEDAPGRNPAGSDLWLDEFSESDAVIVDVQLPEGMSVLIARDGTEAAPDDMVVSWPLDNSTPWAGPLVVAGVFVLGVGLVLYILAIRHQRRGRGPLRKGNALLPTEPIDLAIERAAEKGVITAGDPARSTEPEAGKTEAIAVPASRRRTGWRALPVLGLSLALVTGCSADSWPQFGEPSPTPSPSASVIAPENQQPPAVTEQQALRILQTAATTIAEADEARDIDLAATRLSGAPLEVRRTDYALRGSISDRDPLPAIPTENVSILLPQAVSGWPRTVLLLAEGADGDSAPPTIMTMAQEDPWSNYKLTAVSEMQASTELPGVAPAWLGTQLVPPDSPFLSVAPEDVAPAFADIVDSGESSQWYSRFDDASHALAASIEESRQAIVQVLADNGASETSETAFDLTETSWAPIAMGTLESGAIVAVSVIDSETIKPTTEDAVIRFGDNPEAKALTGVEESAKGVVTTYVLQLFFSVPSQGSNEQVRLLAAHQALQNVEVIE